jgi:hypothetical protein
MKSIIEVETHKALDTISEMKTVMVKGLGYVVVSKKQNDPEMFRRMGNRIAEEIEAGNLKL